MAELQSRGIRPRTINRRLTCCEQYFRFVVGVPLPRGEGVTLAKGHYRSQGYEGQLGLHPRQRRGELSLRVKVPDTLIEPLRAEEVRQFLAGLRHYRDFAIVMAMTVCGLRSCEVISLQLADVQLGRRQFRVMGKGNKERVLPMAAALVEVIGKYLAYERPGYSPAPNLFVNLQGARLGEALTPAGLRDLFRRRRRNAGLPHANPHRFRHTFGADMARAGMSLACIQKMMGHADPAMTMKYIRLSLRDVAEEYTKTMERIGARYTQDKARASNPDQPGKDS